MRELVYFKKEKQKHNLKEYSQEKRTRYSSMHCNILRLNNISIDPASSCYKFMFFANQNSRGKHMDTMKYLVLFAAMKMQKKKNISVILAILNADFYLLLMCKGHQYCAVKQLHKSNIKQ